MKSEPDSGPIWSAWANGKALVGPNKPHSRITVQPSWWLNTTNVAGTRPPAKLPIRYFQTLANDQQEIEIPGVRMMEVDYDVDQDVATLTVQLVNNRFDPDYGSSEWQNSNGDFGRPGYLTGDRGSVSNRWGYVPNEWSGLLVRNALLRCVDTETEILTKRGWLRWDEVDVGDETLGIDPDTGLTEWQEIVEVFRDWHTGGMLPLQGRVHDSLTTRDHRWLLKESDGSFKWSTSEKLRKPSRIPMAARQAAPPEPTYDDAFVELAAWYFTEGTAEHRLRSLDHGGSIAQSIKENPYNVLRIRGVLERLFGAPGPLPRGVFVSQDTVDEVLALRSEGLSYRRIAEKVGVSRHSVERWVRGIRRTTKSFRWNEIPRRTSPDMHDFKFTQAVGRELRKVIVGPDKIPDPRFLASLTQSQAELFIEVSVLADGTDDDGALSFIQGNLERTKAFEMACVLAGQPVHTRGSGTIRKSSLLSVDVCRPARYEPGAVGRPRNDDERARRREVPYDGIVWCPRVKHGNWVARRNGSVYFTGNTYEGYGGQEKTLEQALADGNLVLSGVWLVDDVPIKTGQGFELQARNTGKLLVDQYLYPPLIPAGDYPMSRARFFYSSTSITTAQVIYGTNGLPNSKFRILRIERSLAGGYWLVGTDGGIFTYGPAHFQGSIDSIGLTITPGVYPAEGVTGISRSHTGDGYWLTTDTGAVYCQPVGTMVRVPSGGPSALSHGTYSKYCAGCRCAECREAKRLHAKGYRAGERASRRGMPLVDYEEVPIEALVEGDKVVSFDLATHKLRKRGCTVTRTERRPYVGRLITVTTPDGHTSSYTPDHHCVVRIGRGLHGRHVVYLMRRGSQYRIGRCAWRFSAGEKTGGPFHRAHAEGGDAIWILSVHDTKEDAALAEALAGFDHGIPTWQFVTKGSEERGNKQHIMDLDQFWSKVGDNTKAAARCLSAFGRDIAAPLWDEAQGSLFISRPLVTQATNLVTGMLVLPIDNAVRHQSSWVCGPNTWVTATVGEEWYEGDIVSISVDQDHTYVADGLVTHNSFGDAQYHGGAGLSDPPTHPVIAIETAGTRDGYWLIGADGGVFSFGDVDFYGSLPPLVAGAKIVDGASTPDGLGYWLVDNFGHVYSYGPSANYFGGITGALSAPIVAIASSPTGNGYVMTGKDGGVFAFGDARFYGSVPGLSPPIVLNDPVCDIVVTGSGNGYWLAAEDGGVFAFGDAVFYGSLPQPDTITTDTTTDGNYLDITDIAKDIFLYAGFNLYDGGATDDVYGVVESTGIYVPDEGGNVLDATFFDKLPCQDPLTKLKEIVGYLMYVGDEGEIHWHEPNFFESGNFLPDHSHTATVPVVDERVQLTSYQVNTPDKDLRSEIIISSEDPDLGIAGTVTTSFTPSTARELRGLVRPAMWVNEAFVDSATQQTMAELIALHIYFKSRLGTVACMGNPCLQVDDQVQILERETFETNTHYVRRIHRTHDRKAGTYSMQLTTNVLSPPGSWAVVKPTGTPEGSIVVRRP